MQVTATGIHSSMQGFMAAKAGARYVAPYVNRMDNYGIDGVRVASEIHRTLRSYELKADVLAASFKNSEQVLELVRQGEPCDRRSHRRPEPRLRLPRG